MTWIIGNLINFITRFSVPYFVMFSGAFVLRTEKTSDYKAFYRKSFLKIVVPFLMIWVLWAIIYAAKALLAGEFVSFFESIFRGIYCNLWFMPMLIGLYIVAPLIAKMKRFSLKDRQIANSVGVIFWFGLLYPNPHRNMRFLTQLV